MRAILIVDHGSTLPAANAQLEEVARLLEHEVPGVLVAFAHMELAPPTIAEAIDALAASGATAVALCPYFLAPGRHATEDVPRLAREAIARHPGISLSVAEPLGPDPLLARLVALRARDAR